MILSLWKNGPDKTGEDLGLSITERLTVNISYESPVGTPTMAEVYLNTADGTRYRVGRHHLQPREASRQMTGDPSATMRVFVQKDPAAMKRSYTFEPRESRVLGEQAPERQLREAQYVSRKRFDPSTRDPR